MSDISADSAEWAVRLDDGSIPLRCTCGWQDQVLRAADVARALVLHKPLAVPDAGSLAEAERSA